MSLVEASESIAEILAERGISFPRTPHGKDAPGSYLVRCQNNLDNLVPQKGRDWLYGVFLGDNAKCLMKGLVLVFKTEVVNPKGNWLVADTHQMEELVESHASNLSLYTLGGYFCAAQKVYREFPVYHPKEGIATIPREIPLSQAELILVTKQDLANSSHRIHQSILNKLIYV